MISFFVPGIPKPAGSKRAFMRPGMRFPVVVDDCAKSRDWKGDVKQFAKDVAPIALLQGPLEVTMQFMVTRPKGHFGTGKKASVLKASAPPYPTTKPDVLKLARAVEDAMTGLIYGDDAQIVVEYLSKVYADKPGVGVHVKELVEKPGERLVEDSPPMPFLL